MTLYFMLLAAIHALALTSAAIDAQALEAQEKVVEELDQKLADQHQLVEKRVEEHQALFEQLQQQEITIAGLEQQLRQQEWRAAENLEESSTQSHSLDLDLMRRVSETERQLQNVRSNAAKLREEIEAANQANLVIVGMDDVVGQYNRELDRASALENELVDQAVAADLNRRAREEQATRQVERRDQLRQQLASSRTQHQQLLSKIEAHQKEVEKQQRALDQLDARYLTERNRYNQLDAEERQAARGGAQK
ncbi:MAG: hypothetical protein AB1540_07195 [Bdellovibrionota bacterium]